MCVGPDMRCHGAVTANESAAIPRPEPESRTGESSAAQVAGALARESMRRPWYTYVISYAMAVLLIVPARSRRGGGAADGRPVRDVTGRADPGTVAVGLRAHP